MGQTMMALLRTPDGPARQHTPMPSPGVGEVRVRVLLAGVCRTDVAAGTGRIAVANGRVLGHELVGEVECVGSGVTAVVPGTRVSVRPRLANRDFVGLDVHGAFASHLVVPAAALVRIPVDLDLSRAAFTEPMAAALAVRTVSIARGARIGVTGEGRIAALTRRVLALDEHTVVEGDVAVDVLVHTAAEGLPCLQRVARGGMVIVKSRPTAPVPVDLRAVTERELRLVGVEYGDFDAAVAHLADGSIAVDDLLGPTLPLSSWADAFAADEGRKIFLVPEA